MYEQGSEDQKELTQNSYLEIKEHFMSRFHQIDRDMIQYSQQPEEYEDQMVNFIQEGIGALVAYLPRRTSVKTLADFLQVLDPSLHVVRRDGSAPVEEGPAVDVGPLLEERKAHHQSTQRMQSQSQPKFQEEQAEQNLIEKTESIELPEMEGQIDFVSTVGSDHFVVGTTVGQVAVYDLTTMTRVKTLIQEGMSVYELAYSQRSKRMSLACDGGLVVIYDVNEYEKLGQVSVQRPDITALLYVRDDVLIVGQVQGHIDVITFTDEQATVTHSLSIKMAGDINSMCQGPGLGQFMIACQKGLLFSMITDRNTFQLLESHEEYSNLYVVNISWAGDSRYVVITSRPRYQSKKEIPAGCDNYAIISYTLYQTDSNDDNKRQVILGQYRTSFAQACFPLHKIQVIMPRADSNVPSEVQFKGRFYLVMLEEHLKVVDIETFQLYDLLSEGRFDQMAVSAMGISRSLKDKRNRLLLLCHSADGKSFLQKVEFNSVLPKTLEIRVNRQNAQGKPQKNQLNAAGL